MIFFGFGKNFTVTNEITALWLCMVTHQWMRQSATPTGSIWTPAQDTGAL